MKDGGSFAKIFWNGIVLFAFKIYLKNVFFSIIWIIDINKERQTKLVAVEIA